MRRLLSKGGSRDNGKRSALGAAKHENVFVREESAASCFRFGFNTGLTFPGDLTFGTDSITMDFRTIVWRIKQLGFNAVRLPFTFAHFQDAPVATDGSCLAATVVRCNFAMYSLNFRIVPYIQYLVRHEWPVLAH